MILIDTSGLLSALDESQRFHSDCAGALAEAAPPFLLSPFVLAELDYLLMRHIGRSAQSALLEEVARGVYQIELFVATDIQRAREIADRYKDLDIGLADASIVVLAEDLGIRRIATRDVRRFSALRLGDGSAFAIVVHPTKPDDS